MKDADHEKYWCCDPKELPDAEKLADRIEEKIRKERSQMMELETLMEKIQLPEEGRNCAGSFPMTETVYQNWKNLFYEDTKTFLRKQIKGRTKNSSISVCTCVWHAICTRHLWRKGFPTAFILIPFMILRSGTGGA